MANGLQFASGTGIAAEAAAGIIGPTGHITASDVAPAMIERLPDAIRV